MNLREENMAGFDALLEIAGEEIIKPDGKPICGLITQPELDTEFIPGAEIVSSSLRVRIKGNTAFTTQTIWKARGQTWRLAKFEPHGLSTLLTFESPDN